MAALTSSGLWPAGAYQTFPNPVVYRPVRPRATVNPLTGFVSQTTTSGGSASSTTVPVAPAFTTFPVTP